MFRKLGDRKLRVKRSHSKNLWNNEQVFKALRYSNLLMKSSVLIASLASTLILAGACKTNSTHELSSEVSSTTNNSPSKEFASIGDYVGDMTLGGTGKIFIGMRKSDSFWEAYRGLLVEVDSVVNGSYSPADLFHFRITAEQYLKLFEGSESIDKMDLDLWYGQIKSFASASTLSKTGTRVVEIALEFQDLNDKSHPIYRREATFSVKDGTITSVRVKSNDTASKPLDYTSVVMKKTHEGLYWDSNMLQSVNTPEEIRAASDCKTKPECFAVSDKIPTKLPRK